MKVKFYKKLIPLALVASMAMTQLGVVNAYAETPFAATATVEGAPVVGENPSAALAAEESVTFETLQATNRVNDVKAGLVEHDTYDKVCQLTDTLKAYTDITDDHIKIGDSQGDPIEGVTLKSFDKDNAQITITVAKSALKNGNVQVYLWYYGTIQGEAKWHTAPQIGNFGIEGYEAGDLTSTIADNVKLSAAQTVDLTYQKDKNGAIDADQVATFKLTLDKAIEYENKFAVTNLFLSKDKEGTPSTYTNNDNNVKVELDTTDTTNKTLLVSVKKNFASGTGVFTDGTATWYLCGSVKENSSTTNKVLDATNAITVKYGEKEFIDESQKTAKFDQTEDFSAKYEIKKIGTTDNYGLYRSVPDKGDDGKQKVDATTKENLYKEAVLVKQFTPAEYAALPKTQETPAKEEDVLKGDKATDYKKELAAAILAWFNNSSNATAVNAIASEWTADEGMTAAVTNAEKAGGAIANAVIDAKVDWIFTNRDDFFTDKKILNVSVEDTINGGTATLDDNKVFTNGASPYKLSPTPTDDEIAAAKTLIKSKLTDIEADAGSGAEDATAYLNKLAAAESTWKNADSVKAAKATVELDYLKGLVNATTGAIDEKFDAVLKDSTTWATAYTAIKTPILSKTEYGAIQAGLDGSKIMWVMEKKDAITGKYASNKANASMYGQGVLAKKTATAAKGDLDGTNAYKTDKRYGTAVEIGKTTIPAKNAKFNGEVVLKAVSLNYALKNGAPNDEKNVFAESEFFVNTAVSTKWAVDSITAGADSKVTEGEKPAGDTNAYSKVYDLTLTASKNQKLQFALADGGDKSVVYQASGEGFTVVNGVVKGLSAGSGTIKVMPAGRYDSTKVNPILINVTITDNISAKTSTRANVSNITMYPKATQYITLGTNPATASQYYKISGLDSAYKAYSVTYNNGTEVLTEATAEGLVTTPEIAIKQADATKAGPALNTIKVEVCDSTGKTLGSKAASVKIKWAGAPQNVKTIKAVTKKLNADGVVEVNVPVGSAYNLGLSVNPLTANGKLNYVKGVNATVNTAGKAEMVLPYGQVTGVNNETTLNELGNNNARAYDWISAMALKLYRTAIRNNSAAVPDSSDSDNYAKYTRAIQEAVAAYNKLDAVDVADFSVKGDVVSATEPGTYYVQYETVGRGENGKTVKSEIFKVNVYNPASIFLSTQGESTGYSIVNGTLIDNKNRTTNGSTVFRGGQKLVIDLPATSGQEPVDWSCGKAQAIGFEDEGDGTFHHVALTLNQAGSYNVTAKGRYSGAKLTFKVVVANDTAYFDTLQKDETWSDYQNADNPGVNTVWTDDDKVETDINKRTYVSVADYELSVKEKANAFVFCDTPGYAAKKITFTSSDTSVATVSGSGVITAKKAGTVKITAKGVTADNKEFTAESEEITVNPVDGVFTKFDIATGGIKGQGFKAQAAVKNIKAKECKFIWQTSKKNTDGSWGTWTANESLTSASGKLQIDEVGDYKVRLIVKDKDETKTLADSDSQYEAIVRVYDDTKVVKSLANISNSKDTDAKKAIAALSSAVKVKDNVTTGGTGYGDYYIPIFASAVQDGATLDAAALDDIVWTSNNINLATVIGGTKSGSAYTEEGKTIDITTDLKSIEENAIAKSAGTAYALVHIATTAEAQANGYTGKVVLTGISRNNNKKITVTLNLNGAARKMDDPYLPQVVAATNTGNAVSLTNVVGFTAKEVSMSAEEELAKANTFKQKDKTFTDWQYVIVKESDKYTKDSVVGVYDGTKAEAAYTKVQNLKIAKATDGVSPVTFDTASLDAGNYYLAKAKITYKVDTAYVAADTEKKTPAVDATYSIKDITNISIASKRPMVVAGSGSVTPVTPTEQKEVEIIQHFGAQQVNFGSSSGLPTINGASYPSDGTGYENGATFIKSYELGLTTDKDAPSDSNTSNFGKISNLQNGIADIDKTVSVTTGTTYYLVARTKYKVFDGTTWGEELTGYVVVGTKGFKAKYVTTTPVTLPDGTPVDVDLYEGETFDGTGSHYKVVTAVSDRTNPMLGSSGLTLQTANSGETTKIAIIRHESLLQNEELRVGYIRNTSTNKIVAGPFYFSES